MGSTTPQYPVVTIWPKIIVSFNANSKFLSGEEEERPMKDRRDQRPKERTTPGTPVQCHGKERYRQITRMHIAQRQKKGNKSVNFHREDCRTAKSRATRPEVDRLHHSTHLLPSNCLTITPQNSHSHQGNQMTEPKTKGGA